MGPYFLNTPRIYENRLYKVQTGTNHASVQSPSTTYEACFQILERRMRIFFRNANGRSRELIFKARLSRHIYTKKTIYV